MSTPAEILPLLEGIEWEGDPIAHICPSCRRHQVQGHEKGCDLALLIQKCRHEVRRER